MDRLFGSVKRQARNEVRRWLAKQHQPWVPAPCPSCKADRSETLSQGHERFGFPLRLVSCLECGQLRADPRLRPVLLEELFQRWYRRLYFGMAKLEACQWEQERERGQRALDFVLALRTPPAGARWLDYGCGAGGFVSLLCDQGYRAYGCDIDTSYLDFGQSRGAAVGAPRWDPGLQVVSFVRVLHYLPDLSGTLEQVVSHLQPGGLLYVDLPGVRHWLRGPSCRGRLNRMASLFHLTYFDLHHLEVLMSRYHLRLVGGTEEIRAVFELIPESPPMVADPWPLRTFLSNTRRGRYFWWLLSFLPGSLRRLLDNELAASSKLRSRARA